MEFFEAYSVHALSWLFQEQNMLKEKKHVR